MYRKMAPKPPRGELGLTICKTICQQHLVLLVVPVSVAVDEAEATNINRQILIFKSVI